jgi:hypothetical protein
MFYSTILTDAYLVCIEFSNRVGIHENGFKIDVYEGNKEFIHFGPIPRATVKGGFHNKQKMRQACQTSIDTRPAQPTEVKTSNWDEIITTCAEARAKATRAFSL